MKKATKALSYLLLAAWSLAGGVVNGILGTGGGILIVYIMSRYMREDEYTPKDVFASSMVAVLPISLVSLSTYDRGLLNDGEYILSVMLPAAVGGACGAILSRRLKSRVLQRIFSLIVIYAGIKMIF